MTVVLALLSIWWMHALVAQEVSNYKHKTPMQSCIQADNTLSNFTAISASPYKEYALYRSNHQSELSNDNNPYFIYRVADSNGKEGGMFYDSYKWEQALVNDAGTMLLNVRKNCSHIITILQPTDKANQSQSAYNILRKVILSECHEQLKPLFFVSDEHIVATDTEQTTLLIWNTQFNTIKYVDSLRNFNHALAAVCHPWRNETFIAAVRNIKEQHLALNIYDHKNQQQQRLYTIQLTEDTLRHIPSRLLVSASKRYIACAAGPYLYIIKTDPVGHRQYGYDKPIVDIKFNERPNTQITTSLTLQLKDAAEVVKVPLSFSS